MTMMMMADAHVTFLQSSCLVLCTCNVFSFCAVLAFRVLRRKEYTRTHKPILNTHLFGPLTVKPSHVRYPRHCHRSRPGCTRWSTFTTTLTSCSAQSRSRGYGHAWDLILGLRALQRAPIRRDRSLKQGWGLGEHPARFQPCCLGFPRHARLVKGRGRAACSSRVSLRSCSRCAEAVGARH